MAVFPKGFANKFFKTIVLTSKKTKILHNVNCKSKLYIANETVNANETLNPSSVFTVRHRPEIWQHEIPIKALE